MALDALAHRIAKGRIQLAQPAVQVFGRHRQIGDRALQRGGGALVTQQFHAARHVTGADQQGDGQCQRIGIHVAHADPAHDCKSNEKNDDLKKMSEHDFPVIECEVPQAVLR